MSCVNRLVLALLIILIILKSVVGLVFVIFIIHRVRKDTNREYESSSFIIDNNQYYYNHQQQDFRNHDEPQNPSNMVDHNEKLISEFGTNDYYCTGSCFCVEEDRDGFGEEQHRKSSFSPSSLSSKSTYLLFFLVSSVSYSLALDLAREYFEENCRSDQCDENVMHSEVDDCELMEEEEVFSPSFGDEVDDPYWDQYKNQEEEEEEEEFEEEEEHDDKEYTEFKCEGYCYPVDFVLRAHHVINDDDFDEFMSPRVHNWEFNGPTIVFTTFRDLMGRVLAYCRNKEMKSTVRVERIGSFEYQEEQALFDFSAIHLQKYCKSTSLMTYNDLVSKRFQETKGTYEHHSLEGYEKLIIWKYIKNVYGVDEDVVQVCKAIRHFVAVSPMGENASYMNVVCRRQFSKQEWEEGVPYQRQNLRHWKEGYLVKLEDEKDEIRGFFFG